MGYRKVIWALSLPVILVAFLLSTCSLNSREEPEPEPEAAAAAETQKETDTTPQIKLSESMYLNRDEVRDYINEVSKEHQLDPNKLAVLFAQIKSQQSVLDAVSRPAEKVLTWAQYRPIFISQKRIDAGREFMREHATTLARAEQEFGVPANIIAAIIGVETFYGQVMGKHRVLESVATLAFDYPPRAKFFKSELTEFLVLSQSEKWDTAAVKGSYAGAMGWPQFISSSYRHYAIDFDNDGQRDLFNSVPDVIGSVANYLNEHGWETDNPVAVSLSVSEKQRAAVNALQRKSLKPAISPAKLNELGFKIEGANRVSVMNLQGKSGEEAWVGYKNFYVITRYNHSALYALAVFQLGELLTN